MSQTPSPSVSAQTDRYVTFLGIDFEGQTRRVMQRIELHTLGGGGQDNAFWAYFRRRRQARNGVQCDDLLLLASFVNQVRELFEAVADDQGLAMLDQLEDECF